MKLQVHQEATVEYFIRSKERGVFVLHGTGSGKTLTAITIAERLKRYKEVIILAPKSLHDNMRKEMKRVGADESRYRFVSSNAGNMIDKLETTTDDFTGMEVKSLKLNDKAIIIDEAHNLLVSMSNGAKNATALYDMLMAAKNCKIVLLTASGIINNIYEACIALNICKGLIMTEDGERTTLLPESAEEFERYFVDEKTAKLKNTEKLRNRITGLVSYKGDLFEREVLPFYKMMGTTIKQEHYPDRLPIKLEVVRMSGPQYSAYEQSREKERLETRNAIVGKGPIIIGGELKKSSAFGKSTSYRIRSRQLSNIYYPEDENVNVYENMATYSPKFKSIGDKLKAGVKTIIYSNFVESGIKPMAGYLEYLGYKRFDPNNPNSDCIHGCYGIYSGDVSTDDRTATLNEYNKPNSPLSILLISSSGSEGISTLGTRQLFICESYWNMERLLQVMARGIRYKSHDHLTESERNVQVYIYLAALPKDVKATELTTDMYLFNEAVRKYQINSEMMKLMASVSIECPQFNKEYNFECFKCEPRKGAPLFLNDLNSDLNYPLPCKNDSKPMDVKEMRLNGDLYYVSDDDANKRVFIKTKADEYQEVIDKDVKQWILSKYEEV